jgi:16S rRNA (cytosine967-C5)-methyltransferase
MNPASIAGHVCELLAETDRQTEPADRTTDRFFRERKYLGSRDRKQISSALYGVIRNRRLLEALFEIYVERHPGDSALEATTSRYIPVLAAYRFLFEPAEPPLPEAVWKISFPDISQEKFRHWVGENAGLGFLPGDEAVRLGVKYSFQDWMVEEFLRTYGPETEALLTAMNQASPAAIRVNTLKTTREACRERLAAEGIITEPTLKSPDGLAATRRFQLQGSPAYQDGWFEMQDEGSQIISLIANPQPGETLIDATAGAGGKSLHCVALMGNTGSLIAADIDTRRLGRLRDRALRAGATIIRSVKTEELKNIVPENGADLVCVDAPCSGIGTIRRSPWLKWSVRETDIRHHTGRQAEILLANSRFVGPGGRLVYSTCSLIPAENQEIIVSFLSQNPNFEPVPFTIPGPSGADAADGMYTLLPQREGTDGFFVAMMRRRA